MALLVAFGLRAVRVMDLAVKGKPKGKRAEALGNAKVARGRMGGPRAWVLSRGRRRRELASGQ